MYHAVLTLLVETKWARRVARGGQEPIQAVVEVGNVL